MSESNKREHANTDKRPNQQDLQYGKIFYVDQQQPPPYHSPLPPPYYYITQNVGLQALPFNKENPPLRESFYSKRPLVPEKTSEDGGSKTEKSKRRKVEKKKDADGKEKLSILKRISNGIVFGLESFFYKLGLLIATHPKKTIAVAVVVAGLCGIGLIRLETDRDFAGLLIPSSSRYYRDQAWVDENIPYSLRYARLIVENDNVLTRESLLALHDIYTTVLDVRVDNGIGFSDLCNNILGNCYAKSILSLWGNDREVIETLTEEDIVAAINTTDLDPTYYVPFEADAILGSPQYDSDGKIIAAGAMSMTLYLMETPTNMESNRKFEKEILALAERNWEGLQQVSVLTLDSFRDEFFDAVYGDMILLVYIFPIVGVYMIFAMGKANLVEHGLLLVIAAVFGVLLSASICYGLCLAVGLTYGATHTGLIFLLLGIGVDDTFVVLETWKRVSRENPDKSIEEKMALTMKHAGVSVTVTSISDFTAFAAGISSLMPVLSSFCVYCAVGIFALFIIQSTFFPACVALDQMRVRSARNGCMPCYKHKNYKPNKFSKIEILEPLFKKVWGRLLLSIPGKIIVLLVSAGLLGTMTWSLLQMEKGFDVARNLPEGSSSHQFLLAIEKHYPGNGYPFEVYCDTKDYYLYHKELERMEKRYSNSSAVLDGKMTSWIRPFKYYIEYLQRFGQQIEVDEDGFPVGRESFNQYLYDFVHVSGFGDAYKVYINVNDDSSEFEISWTIYRGFSTIVYDSNVNEQRLAEVRGIADTTVTDGTCFAHGAFFVFAETSTYVTEELIRNMLLAGVSVFVVVLLLVVDLRSSFFVLMCVAFTTVCLGGTLQFSGFVIEGTVVILSTFCIGLSVDFSAHVAYMFMTVRGARNERAQKTLEKIGPAILHGAFSTLIVTAILVTARSHTLFLFFVALVSIMGYGLFAGLVLLPVVLSLIGPDPYPDAENFKNPRIRHRWFNSELISNSGAWTIPRPKLINTPETTRSENQDQMSGRTNSAYQSSDDDLIDTRR